MSNSNAPFLSPSLPTPEWLRDNPPLYNEQPWNVAHANGSGAMLANPYQQTDHTSATTPVLGQQAMPWARKPVTAVPTAPRQRLLAPAAPRRETVSRDARPTIAPVPNRRLVLPPSRSSNRVTKKKKVLQACERCRELRQGCDGERPRCRRCDASGCSCRYSLTPRQIRDAQKKAAQRGERTSELVEQPKPVEAAPAGYRDSTIRGRLRPILPYPAAAPRQVSTGLRPRRDGTFQEPSWAFDEIHTSPNALSQPPQQADPTFGGLSSQPNGLGQHPQEPYSTSGSLGARFDGLPHEYHEPYHGPESEMYPPSQPGPSPMLGQSDPDIGEYLDWSAIL